MGPADRPPGRTPGDRHPLLRLRHREGTPAAPPHQTPGRRTGPHRGSHQPPAGGEHAARGRQGDEPGPRPRGGARDDPGVRHELLDTHDGSIMLVHGDGELRTVSVSGSSGARGARLKFGEGIAGQVAETREPVLVTGVLDPGKWTGGSGASQPPNSSMSVPLVYRDALLGVLNVNAAPEPCLHPPSAPRAQPVRRAGGRRDRQRPPVRGTTTAGVPERLPGAPRPAHEPARTAPSSSTASTTPCRGGAPPGQLVAAPVPRPRRLQAHQRQPGPRRRATRC